MGIKTDKKFISDLEKEKLDELKIKQNQLNDLLYKIGKTEVELVLMKNQAMQLNESIHHESNDFNTKLFNKYGNVSLLDDGEIVSPESQDSK